MLPLKQLTILKSIITKNKKNGRYKRFRRKVSQPFSQGG